MWKRFIGAAAALALTTSLAFAQTNPGLTQNQKLTPAQWNNLFASKQDTLGYTPMNAAGGVFGGRVVTAAPGASTSGLNLTPGSTPGSPSNGDLWVTSSGFFARVNGVTIGPIGGGSASSFAGTSPVEVSFPAGVTTYACSTCGVTGSPLSQFASTTSAQLAGVLSNETGTGLAVFNDAPTLIAPILGAATATSINKVAITTPATSATLTIANGKTFTASNSLTLSAASDGGNYTMPPVAGSRIVLDTNSAQSLTNKTLSGSTNVLGGVTMTLGSDGAGDLYYRNSGGVLTRLPIGSNTNILTVSGGLPSWQAGTAASTVNVGTTTISGSCSTGQLLWNNAGTSACANQSSSLAAGAGISLTGTTTVTVALTSAWQTKPTKQVFTAGASGTYTTPANVQWIEIHMVGGGGGGGGGANSSSATTGNNTCWNTSGSACTSPVYQAGGGSPGAGASNASAPPAGGAVSGSGTCDWSVAGGSGTGSTAGTTTNNNGGAGGNSSFGGAGGGGAGNGGTAGASAAANSGSGGGGGGVAASSLQGGSGGGGGATCHVIITSPAASYTYAAASSAAGASGSGGGNGGSGGGGQIIVYEHYGN